MYETIDLSAGTIRYRDRGAGPTVLFVHGALVDSRLWDGVAEPLSATHRVIQPDLPLGSQTMAMNADADLSPSGVAQIVLEFMEQLALVDVTIVGNDTGGAVTQMVVTADASRIDRMVLTTCDAFDVFPPRFFSYFKLVGRFRALAWVAGQAMRFSFSRNLPTAYGWLSVNKIPAELTADWTRPMRIDAGVRRDTRKLLAAITPAETEAVGVALADFDRPTLLVWGRSDRFFPARLAEKLDATLPDSRIVWIDDTATFVPLDQPEKVAELISEFVPADG